MTPATFPLQDDPESIPVNDTTKPEKWMVELIRSHLMQRSKERQEQRKSASD